MGAAPHKVALTFDDGPDPEWTPKILDILKEKKAPATFFVIGESANEYDDIVKREYAHGEEIGNHTFTHPDFETIKKSDLEIQLNLTELLIESSLGVKTTLFRPPYGIDHQPETASEIQMLPVPQDMGYVIVGARIDPHDWGEADGGTPPPANDIVQRVLSGRRKRTRATSFCCTMAAAIAATPSRRCRRSSTACAPRATNSFPSRICWARRARR